MVENLLMSKRFKILIFGLALVLLGLTAIILATAAGWLDLFSLSQVSRNWDKFPTTPKVEMLSDGLELRLLEDFVYIDPRGKVWLAPKDFIVDGASIPRAFWTVVGGPLDGKYRNASIVHDEACVRREEPSEDVHLMFYEACRCGGIPEEKAKVMYAAVYHFGPRWELDLKFVDKTLTTPAGETRTITVREAEAKNATFTRDSPAEVRDKLEKYINERNPPLEELKNIDPSTL